MKKAGTTPSSGGRRKQQAWDTYQTDISGFKLSREEILRKKKLLVSKNNILVETSETERARIATQALRSERAARLIKKSPAKPLKISKYFGSENSVFDLKRQEEITVLDVLDESIDDSALSAAVGAGDDDDSKLEERTFVLGETKKSARYSQQRGRELSFASSSVQQKPVRPSPPKPVTPRAASATASVTTSSRAGAEDMTEVVELLRALTAEIRYYEAVTGRTGIFLCSSTQCRLVSHSF